LFTHSVQAVYTCISIAVFSQRVAESNPVTNGADEFYSSESVFHLLLPGSILWPIMAMG
jgi:hypothetical protein